MLVAVAVALMPLEGPLFRVPQAAAEVELVALRWRLQQVLERQTQVAAAVAAAVMFLVVMSQWPEAQAAPA